MAQEAEVRETGAPQAQPHPAQPQETPDVRYLLQALKALDQEQSVLASAIADVEDDRKKQALEKLRLLTRRVDTAKVELETALSHLKLYFALVWLKAGAEQNYEEIRDIDELLELFHIDDLSKFGHMDDPRSLDMAYRLMSKVVEDLEHVKRVRSAQPTARKLRLMARSAERGKLKARAAFLGAATGIVLLGIEDMAMHHLMPMLNTITGMETDTRGCGPGCSHNH